MRSTWRLRCSRLLPLPGGKEVAVRFVTEAVNILGAVLLQIAVGLLIEELTFAGLVRLILAPRPVDGKDKGRSNGDKGENKCSH